MNNKNVVIIDPEMHRGETKTSEQVLKEKVEDLEIRLVKLDDEFYANAMAMNNRNAEIELQLKLQKSQIKVFRLLLIFAFALLALDGFSAIFLK